jgi:hypothetical protein
MKRHVWPLATLCLAAILASCDRAPSSSGPAWDSAHVATLRLELIDPVDVQSLWFSPDGGASASFGTKTVETPTIVSWRISDGRLVLFNDEFVIDELSLISESQTRVVARSKSGKILEYRKVGR